MKKIFTSLCVALLCSGAAFAQAVLNGTTYVVDTICQRQEGPGIVFTQVRLADYPLNAYVLEMDMTNPYNRIETTQAYNTLGKQETLANAYTRHKAEGKKPIAACNGNFWVVTGHGEPWISFMLGTPFGAVVYNDTTFVNTNTTSDLWNGGPTRTASAAVAKDKTLYLGRFLWSGKVSSSKFSNALSLVQINKRCQAGELALFSQPYGRTRTLNAQDGSNFVYLTMKSDSKWAVNADMKFVVADVKLNTNGLTLGDYDAVLVGEGDAYEPELAKLSVGDEITINEGWVTMDGTTVAPLIENMVEGNAQVMKDGELTARNNDESYNSMTYSRCAYGCDKTGKKLYMMVIDMSTNEYGRSSGCSTTIMCQLWKYMCPDLWNVVNFDAGGSAQMMLNGSVINKTTEGTPRAVACGWMLYSSAPGDDKTIASIKFENPHLSMPVLSSYSPKIIGYNQYGEVVDRDVKVTYEIDSNIGTSEGSVVVANATPGIGKITAKYGDGITVTAPIVTKAAQMAIRIQPQILIDATREYSVEVVSEIGRSTFNYNPAHLTWTNTDSNVASLTDGVLKGLKEGESEITCSLNGFSDTTSVKVEIAKAPTMNLDWTGWTLKSTGGKNLVLSSDGVLSMTYSGGRGPYISLAKEAYFYSLPDKIYLDFTSTIPLQYIQVDFRSNTMTESNYLVLGKEDGGYEANKEYKIELPISDLGDPNDLALYPISLRSIRFTPRTSGFTSGANSITFHGLYGEYKNYSGVEEAKVSNNEVKIYPNPVTDGVFTVCAANADKADVSVYNQAGALVYEKTLNVNGGSATVEAGLASGIYFVKVATAEKTAVNKLLVK